MKLHLSSSCSVAYFCMEVGLADLNLPTYAGGLGILAGDTLRAAADLGVPLVGVTLLHRKGYFHQHLDAHGLQSESDQLWRPQDSLELMPEQVDVQLEGRKVRVQAWKLEIRGVTGHVVPVYFLDSDLPSNSEWDRGITDHLYGGDQHYRLCQEVVLGFGGIWVLWALGYDSLRTFHMNEGHSSLLTLALLEGHMGSRGMGATTNADIETIRSQCVFTTHTPVPAGHDQFPWELVQQVLTPQQTQFLSANDCCHNGRLNMTYLALRNSRYINGVAMRHGQVSRGMFPNYPINAITNGVHAVNWTAPPIQELFDRHFPEWRKDNNYLRYAVSISLEEIRTVHKRCEQSLSTLVEQDTGLRLNPDFMTIGFARRAAEYKRADLIFSDPDRLDAIARHFGGLQLVFAGKAHPSDPRGADLIRRIISVGRGLQNVRVVYLENYNVAMARTLVAGVDLWLNTPQRPQEASGTSGMKAALNGVPSFSIRDGWWVEGHAEGLTGWSIGENSSTPDEGGADALSLYDKLERVILPLYHGRPQAYAEVMRSAIAFNGSFFNSQRMVQQYLADAYALEAV